MSRLCRVATFALVAAATAATSAQENATVPSNAPLRRGATAYAAGDVARAAREWERALGLSRDAGDRSAVAEARVRLASAYEAAGQYARAKTELMLALDELDGLRRANAPAADVKEAAALKRRRAVAAVRLGSVHTLTHRYDQAAVWLSEAQRIAAQLDDGALRAAIHNNVGNLFAAQGKHAVAVEEYREAVDLASAAQAPELAARARANAALAAERATQADEAQRLAVRALSDAGGLPDTAEKAQILLAAARALQRTSAAEATPADDAMTLRRQAYDALVAADAVAKRIGNPRLRSYALGEQAALYEAAKKWDDALTLAQRASFFAQRALAPEALFRRQWQVGRILATLAEQKRAAGDLASARQHAERAIQALTQSKESLQSIRNDVALGYGNHDGTATFRDDAGQLYFQLADLLLRRVDDGLAPDEEQRTLRQARATVELLKAGELEDYFQDECVNQVRRQAINVDAILGLDTAVVYVIPLRDRVELLVSRKDGLRRIKHPAVGAAALDAEARAFRVALQRRARQTYRDHGKRLYEWLIKPIEEAGFVHENDTLVFIPDGALRLVPMAALYDGSRFLIEKYAVAVTPGLTLTDPRPFGRRNVRLLAGGISEQQTFPGKDPARPSVFAPLPAVQDELADLGRLYSTRPLLNSAFNVGRFDEEIRGQPYRVVHVASHGVFAPRAEDTFVLAYGEKISLNRLEGLIQPNQFKGRPVELLTLSACETAKGDDRAALGLAGIAIKAGARSAVASLWCADDKATAELMSGFYSELQRDPNQSKAQAMRAVQRNQIADPDRQHPVYWAAFLVIGNWL